MAEFSGSYDRQQGCGGAVSAEPFWLTFGGGERSASVNPRRAYMICP